ncbi:MAG TPA: branched-chain amino acid ABC transporter substrate-binding protein [Burkholderiaceae bacterium]|jgi:branched-chain amino acid transport system substrate-binding protein
MYPDSRSLISRFTAGLVPILALSLLAACSREVTVKIGVAAPMSGALAQYGKDIAQGAQTAADELNEDHFIINGRRAHFELVVEDDKASADEGKAVAQRFVDAKVNGVFANFNSGVTIPSSAIYSRAGIPQISVSTNTKYTRQGFKTAFRITADDSQQGRTLALLMADKLHAKSIYIIDDGTPFGVGLVDEVNKVLAKKNIAPPHDSVTAQTANYAALVQKIKDSKADSVFFSGDQGVGLPLLKELRKSDTTTRFIVADAMCDASTVKDAAGDANSNYYCTIAGVPSSWLSAGAGFVDLYKKKYNAPPGTYSTLAYDGIHIFAQAMQEANSTDPAVYLPVLAKGSFDGKIQGSVEFDAKGDIKDGTVVIFQSIGGQLNEQRNL